LNRTRGHPTRPRRRGRIRRLRCVAGVLAVLLIASACSRRDSAGVSSNEFTLYVLGGSTALGHPYEGYADFGRIAEWLCNDRIGGRAIRVENVAGSGKPASVCVDDAHRIARHPAEQGRAAAFVYIGNNEFTAYERKQDLSRRSPRSQFDVPQVADAERDYVHARSRTALTEIIRALRAAHIEPIVGTIAVNLADWEPNRSVLSHREHADIVAANMQAGDAALQAGDPRAAREQYAAVLALEPRFALAFKRIGDCDRALGEPPRAREFYQRAVDYDAGPIRETREQNRIVREVCAANDVEMVDAPGILAAASFDGLVGWNFMWDNCHLTPRGLWSHRRRIRGCVGGEVRRSRTPAVRACRSRGSPGCRCDGETPSAPRRRAVSLSRLDIDLRSTRATRALAPVPLASREHGKRGCRHHLLARGSGAHRGRRDPGHPALATCLATRQSHRP